MGGVNLLNKAGHEALGRQGNKVVQPYKVYADEPLNPRIANPVLQGNSLIAVIDKVPCSIQLTDNVVDAHRSGALPLKCSKWHNRTTGPPKRNGTRAGNAQSYSNNQTTL